MRAGPQDAEVAMFANKTRVLLVLPEDVLGQARVLAGRATAALKLPVSLQIAPLVAIALTQLAVFATSIYLHRALAHRALAVHPVADVFFRTVLWLTTGQRRQEWVAVHRKHHAFTDREGDPHSPRLLGVWRVQLLDRKSTRLNSSHSQISYAVFCL